MSDQVQPGLDSIPVREFESPIPRGGNCFPSRELDGQVTIAFLEASFSEAQPQ
jgi:hypothetical protein